MLEFLGACLARWGLLTLDEDVTPRLAVLRYGEGFRLSRERGAAQKGWGSKQE